MKLPNKLDEFLNGLIACAIVLAACWVFGAVALTVFDFIKRAFLSP